MQASTRTRFNYERLNLSLEAKKKKKLKTLLKCSYIVRAFKSEKGKVVS